MTYGEKHLRNSVERNKVIREAEWRVFNHNFLDLLEEIRDYVSDDWEVFQDKGVFFNSAGEFSTADADNLLDWVLEIIKQEKEEEDFEGDEHWLEKWVSPLKEAEGFTLHLNYLPEWAREVRS